MHWKIVGALSCFFLSVGARADQLIINGGFETGDFTGWTTVSSAASGGAWYVCPNAVNCPASTGAAPDGNPTVGPNSGTYYAVTASLSGPGTNVLYQSFIDPFGTTSATLSFAIFVNDYNGSSGTAIGKVDLLAGSANPLTGTPITTFYSADTDASVNGPNPYVPYSGDIASFMTPGSAYYLRFYESDSGAPNNVGVDSVSLVTPTSAPEPAMVLPVVLIAGYFLTRSRRLSNCA